MKRSYMYHADGRKFFCVKERAKNMLPSWEGRGNPWLWFSWEVVNGERDYLACGVSTIREAQEPIDKLCGITG